MVAPSGAGIKSEGLRWGGDRGAAVPPGRGGGAGARGRGRGDAAAARAPRPRDVTTRHQIGTGSS